LLLNILLTMDCKSIGQANPDIAGIGILVAFIVQSLIAVLVSAYTWILSSTIQQRWNQAVRTDPELEISSPEEDPFTNWLRSYSVKTREWLESFWVVREILSGLPSLQSDSETNEEEPPEPPKAFAWPAWLIGKQPENPLQRNSKTKIDDEITPTTRRLECANQVLLAGSDTQTFTGIALLISALIQSKFLTFYHMHIIYDTVSLVM
jgi:hypothetical protein